jgi:hypothetical protein
MNRSLPSDFLRLLLLLAFCTFNVKANLIPNGDFENPGFTDTHVYLPNGNTSILPGWTVIDDGVGAQSYVMKNPPFGAIHTGSYAVTLNQGAGLTTTFAATAGTTYEVSFWAAGTGNTPLFPFLSPLDVTVGTATTSFSFPTYDLYENKKILFTASIDNPAVILKFFNPSSSGDTKAYSFDTVSVTSVPDAGSTLALLGFVLLIVPIVRKKMLASIEVHR